MRPHRSVGKTIRRAGWHFTTDRDFGGVMRACAAPTPDRPQTWISEEFVKSYTELHRRGLAHSLEVWEGDRDGGRSLRRDAGGLLRRRVDVPRRTDASKAAVSFLVDHLRAHDFTLLDAQVPTAHLRALGATEIPRAEYLRRLRSALARNPKF